MLLFYAFLLLVGLVIFYYSYITFSRKGRFLKNIPGPINLPFIGGVHAFTAGNAADVWKKVRAYGKRYRMYKVWSLMYSSIAVRHPDDVEAILSSTKLIQKSMLYELLLPWFGTGLLTSSGSKWQKRRKILTPAFHFNVLQQFVEIIIEETEYLVGTLKAEKGPVVRDLLHFISEHALNIICETAMGTSLKGRGEEFQYKYRNAIYDLGKILLNRLMRPWLMLEVLHNCTLGGFKQWKILNILHGFTKKIIKERKQYHENTGGKYLAPYKPEVAGYTQTDDEAIGIRRKRLAMLDLLLAAQKENLIDDEGIREEVDTFMFEGHDTSAMAMCYSIMLLAEHPEIQEKVRAEVDEVFLQCDGKLTMSCLQSLPYLERCIKETLRLYPSVHFISRHLHEDLPLNGHTIPAGCIAVLHIVDTHRDPEFWSQPNVFDPDRFLPENSHGRHNYCYIPFSAGPRNCIGQRFAMLEIKATIAYLIHNFYFEPVDYLENVRFLADIVLRPGDPIRTKFIPIK